MTDGMPLIWSWGILDLVRIAERICHLCGARNLDLVRSGNMLTHEVDRGTRVFCMAECLKPLFRDILKRNPELESRDDDMEEKIYERLEHLAGMLHWLGKYGDAHTLGVLIRLMKRHGIETDNQWTEWVGEGGAAWPLTPQAWIYPGERRPVVVYAMNETLAAVRVRESPQYDGLGSKVYSVEEFARLCQEGKAP